MGDPRKIRKKYETPAHPWQKDRIEKEKELLNEYGLKNKTEIWRMETLLKKFKDQVKALASRDDKQSNLEEKQLVNHLMSLGLMTEGAALDTILSLELKDVFERRLQTILVRKSLARSMKQARQFITHGHVLVDKKKVTFPSYILRLKEEALVEFVPSSALSRDDHPERVIEMTAKEKAEKKKKEKKEEEAPSVFAKDEIEEIEEKGIVEKKKEAKQEVKKAKQVKPEEKKEKSKQDKKNVKKEKVKVEEKKEPDEATGAKKEEKVEEKKEEVETEETKEVKKEEVAAGAEKETSEVKK